MEFAFCDGKTLALADSSGTLIWRVPRDDGDNVRSITRLFCLDRDSGPPETPGLIVGYGLSARKNVKGSAKQALFTWDTNGNFQQVTTFEKLGLDVKSGEDMAGFRYPDSGGHVHLFFMAEHVGRYEFVVLDPRQPKVVRRIDILDKMHSKIPLYFHVAQSVRLSADSPSYLAIAGLFALQGSKIAGFETAKTFLYVLDANDNVAYAEAYNFVHPRLAVIEAGKQEEEDLLLVGDHSLWRYSRDK